MSTSETLGETARSDVDPRTQDIAERVGMAVGDQKQSIADQVLGVANALEMTALQLERQGQTSMADYARRASESLHRLGHRIEEKGAAELMHEVERLGREQPVLLASSAAAIGFALTRLLRSSAAPAADATREH